MHNENTVSKPSSKKNEMGVEGGVCFKLYLVAKVTQIALAYSGYFIYIQNYRHSCVILSSTSGKPGNVSELRGLNMELNLHLTD